MQYEFKYADLLDDDVFKLVFGQESSKDVMIEFLNQVIDDRTIVDLDFMDKEMKSVDRERKDSVYDMFCKTDDGSRIVVEVQRRKQASYVERTIYYSTFQVRNQVDAGSSDYSFCPVYVINILDFNINENKGNPEVKTVYRLHEEKTHTLLTDKLTFIFLELNKFNKGIDQLDGDVLEGMYFCLKNMANLDGCPEVLNHEVFKKMFAVSELVKMDEVIICKNTSDGLSLPLLFTTGSGNFIFCEYSCNSIYALPGHEQPVYISDNYSLIGDDFRQTIFTLSVP